jgi:DNA invertase Pin-like site-specific DNA recombinase
LPRDLPGALTQLTDAEVDSLLAAAIAEAKRRGRLIPTSSGGGPAEARSRSRQVASDDGAGLLTTAKLNAVRAAFKAGVKPAAIARQFGISQSDVRRALAAERQKAGR